MQHIRIPDDIDNVMKALRQKGGLYPRFDSRSTAHVACELIREAPSFREAAKQMESEKHSKPGGNKR